VAVRLTKPTRGCKRFVLALMIPLSLVQAAGSNRPPPESALRDCIAQARDSAAVANCEKQAQSVLKEHIEGLSAAIRLHLNQSQREVFDRSASAWQTFFEHETALLELSLGQRRDGLGPKLRSGAITLLYEQRERQLREHLHNLSVAAPPAGRQSANQVRLNPSALNLSRQELFPEETTPAGTLPSSLHGLIYGVFPKEEPVSAGRATGR